MTDQRVSSKVRHNPWRLFRIPLLVVAVLAVPIIGAAQANTDDTMFTGCLTKYGLLVRVAEGDEPLRPCLSKHTEVQWSQQGPMGPAGADGADGPAGPVGPPGSGGEYYVVNELVPAPDLEQPDPVLYDGTRVSEQWAPGEYSVSCDPGDVGVDIRAYRLHARTRLDTGEAETEKANWIFDPVVVGSEAPNTFVNQRNVFVSHAFEIYAWGDSYEEVPTELTYDLQIFLTCADVTP